MTGKISEFQEYIRKAVTPFHSVEAGISLLRQAGFEELTYFRTSPFLIPCFAFTNIIPCPSKIWNTFFANFHFFPHKTGACFANHPQNTLLTVIYPLFYSFTVCFSILIPISLPLPPQVVRPHTVLSFGGGGNQPVKAGGF